MAGPFHSWMWLTSGDNEIEVLNAARTSAYLRNASLAPAGFDVCNVFDYGTCQTYTKQLYVGPNQNGWFDFSGVSGNYASAPDSAALDIAGDLTLIAHVIADDWTPSAQQTIVGKWGAAGQRSYELCLTTSGALIFQWSVAGTTIVSATSTVNLSALANGAELWVAADIDVSVGGNKTVRFWTSATGLVWTQLGTSVTTATATSIFVGTALLTIGASNAGTAENFAGRIGEVQVLTGIGTTQPGGTSVFTINGSEFTDAAAASITASTGQVVTKNTSGSPGTTIIARRYCNDWETQSYTTPTLDSAPWYNANYPESADALGFYVEEWTGLGNDHVKGVLVSTGRAGGGGRVGPLGSQGRVMKINLFAMARTEDAMQYLFDWLSMTLIGSCSGCGDDTLLFRRFCGSPSDPSKGLGEMRNVRLVEGPTWEAEPVSIPVCTFRRLSFTLTAGDPCIYLPATAVASDPDNFTANLTTCFGATNVDEERYPCRPTCTELPTSCRAAFNFTVNPLGAMAPIVETVNNTAEPTVPMRILLFSDPNGIGVTPNPCGLPLLAEVYVRSLPPYSSFTWDIAGRTTYFRDSTTGTNIEGGPYVDFNDPPVPRYASLPCGAAWLVFEPGSLCFSGAGPWTDPNTGHIFAVPTFPTATVRMQERVSCS